MTRGKRKAVTFDAMVKFFMHNYDIPTKKDVQKLHARLDRLEKLIKNAQISSGRKGRAKAGTATAKKRGRMPLTASEVVFRVIKRSKKGLTIKDIKSKTTFEDKKLRNILFRLHSLGMIKRVSRGVYKAV